MTELGRFFAYLLIVVGFAWLARRLLGAVRVSWARAIAAGLVGAAVGTAAAVGLRRWGVEDDASAAAVAFVAAILVSMGVIVAFQLVAVPRRSAVSRRQGIVGAIEVARRTADVARIAARHGLGPYVGKGGGEVDATPAHLRQALEEAGVVFVKFGQMLAGRPDLVGPTMAAELSTLRYDVTPVGAEVMRPELSRALPDADEALASIDWTPLGSASIAQVYPATLADGREVVIKIRRPGVDDEVRRDGRVIADLARRLEQRSAWARSAGISDLADAFVRDLVRELDYTAETRAGAELAGTYEGSGIRVPAVHADLSRENVLVIERVNGDPLSRRGLGDWPPEARQQAAAALLSTNVTAMLEGSRFHADLHPGNVMVDDHQHLWLIDFGATGVLTAPEQSSLSTLLLGFRLREPALIRDALLEVATSDRPVDVARVDRGLAHLLAEHVTPSENVGPEAVAELMRILHEEGLRVPARSSAMFRSLVTVLDSLEQIAPDFAVLDALESTSSVHSPVPSSAGDLAVIARDETLKLLPLLRRAPRLTDSVVTQLDRGDLTIRGRILSHPDDIRLVTQLVNRVVLAFVAGVLGIVSAMLFALQQGPYLTDDVSIYDVVASIGLLSGAVLIMRVVLEALDSDGGPSR